MWVMEKKTSLSLDLHFQDFFCFCFWSVWHDGHVEIILSVCVSEMDERMRIEMEGATCNTNCPCSYSLNEIREIA